MPTEREVHDDAQASTNHTTKVTDKESDESIEEDAPDLPHEVIMFFRDPSLLARSPDVRMEHSSRLLQRALDRGILAEVRSLYLWRLRVAVVSDDNIRDICEACERLALYSEKQDLLDFYDELFISPRFVRMSGETKVYCALLVQVNAIPQYLRNDGYYSGLRRALLHGSRRDIELAFNSVCDKLLEAGRPGDVVSLLSPINDRIARGLLDLRPVEDKVFSFTLSTGQLWYCTGIILARLERIPPGTDGNDEVFQLVQALFQKAHNSKQYDPVACLLERASSRSFLERVYVQMGAIEKTCLAMACTKTNTDCQGLWDGLFKNIPEHAYDEIIQARTVDKLRGAWRTTRNLDLTNKLFDETLDWIDTNCPENRPLQLNLRLTMVEILNAASKPALALRHLEKINESHAHSSLSLSSTAATLAEKGAWKELYQLVDILGRWAEFTISKEVLRNLNTMLGLYSAKHSADEVWDFVTELVVRLRIHPNMATMLIVLKHFILQRALYMIPRWLRFLKTMGIVSPVSSSIAADVLQKYCQEYRPSHVVMFWISRWLIDNTGPGWKLHLPASLVSIVKESIASDLRRHGNHRHQLRARQNLKLLEQAQGEIPEPVNSISDALRLREQRVANAQCLDSISEGVQSYNSFPKEHLHEGNDTRSALPSSLNSVEELRETKEHELGSNADEMGAYTPFPEDNTPERVAASHAKFSPADSDQVQMRPFTSEDYHLRLAHPVPSTPQGYHNQHEAQQSLEDNSADNWNLVLNAWNSVEETEDDDTADFPFGQPDEEVSLHQRVSISGARGRETTTDPARVMSSIVASAEQTPVLPDQTDNSSFADGGHSEKQCQADMLLALSRREYERVLSLYGKKMATSGIPSINMVRLAVSASLRLQRGRPHEAEEILRRAREAGINTDHAMNELLTQRIWQSSRVDKKDFRSLTTTVVEYYQALERSGVRGSNHVAATACNILTNNFQSKAALKLLKHNFQSPRGLKLDLDIAVMTIFLKAFAKVRSPRGIRWVVETVLEKDIPISPRFLDTLRWSSRMFDGDQQRAAGHGYRAAQDQEFIKYIKYWRAICLQRRREQRQCAGQLGWGLVRVLATCGNHLEYTFVPSSVRKQVEVALLGKAERTVLGNATKEELEIHRSSAVSLSEHDMLCHNAIAKMKKVLYIPAESTSQSQEPRPIHDEDWLMKYRLMLRQRLLIDGKRAVFRYKLDVDVRDWIPEDAKSDFEVVVQEAQLRGA